MIIISARDFRANQTKFLNMANDGKDVVLMSRSQGSFRIVPVNDDDVVVERDLVAELKGALQEVKDNIQGKQELKSLEQLIDEL